MNVSNHLTSFYLWLFERHQICIWMNSEISLQWTVAYVFQGWQFGSSWRLEDLQWRKFVSCSHFDICNWIVLTQWSHMAIECSHEKWLKYVNRISNYAAEQLVFVDESSVDHWTTYWGRAWSIRGMLAHCKAFFVLDNGKRMPIKWFICFDHSFRFSVLPTLSYKDGIMHCEIIEGSFCTETFQCFISCLLDYMQPFPTPNSIIVMDNCCIHKHPDIINMIESRFVLVL